MAGGIRGDRIRRGQNAIHRPEESACAISPDALSTSSERVSQARPEAYGQQGKNKEEPKPKAATPLSDESEG